MSFFVAKIRVKRSL